MRKNKIIASICCLAMGMSLLTGCSLAEEKIVESIKNVDIVEVKDKIVQHISENEELQYMAEDIYEKLLIGVEKTGEIATKLMEEHAENLKIKEVEKTDEYVTVEITAPNLNAILDDIMVEFEDELSKISEEDIQNFLQEKVTEVLESKEFETITENVKVEQFIDENGNLKIVENNEYIEAIHGGLLDLYQAYQDKLEEEQSKNN